jgi:TATA-binding protein-associated factor Taf7
MILDQDVCMTSDESVSAYAGRMAAMITNLRRAVKEYADGTKTLEELLDEAKVPKESEEPEMKEESPITELLLDQLDELRHAISQHRREVMSGGAYDLSTMTQANSKLWEVLE